jgi:hypothetical protein
VKQQAAAGALDVLELLGEHALGRSDRLSSLGEAGLLDEGDEAFQARSGASPGERGAQRFGDLRGVQAGDVEVGEPLGPGLWA